MIHHIPPSPSPSPSPAPPSYLKNSHNLAPSPSPLPTTTISSSTSASSLSTSPPPSKLPIDFSPPLIAMVVIIVTAFIIITYSRLLSRHLLRLHGRYKQWRRRRRRYVPSSAGDIESPPYSFDPTDAFHVLSPYGLDESVIKTIPLSIYTCKRSNVHDCAVCLLEFEEHDYVRTLPVCAHAFHVDCIDIWLKSHANCPLCRAGVFRPESPFTPLMAARIRPSFDDINMLVESAILEPLAEIQPEIESTIVSEITQEMMSINIQSEERFNGRDILLKRSYSFGFERNLGSERLVLEATTASPWRYRRAIGSGSFWSSKRPSPFSSLTKPRVFSFRYYRGMKSPFFRRNRGGFLPLSERYSTGGGGGSSSRRSKSFASPMFMRTSGAGGVGGGMFSSSRLRSGDPEALLSPDRYNRR